MDEISVNKQIVWLASYPKSGNTWFRSFLTALLNEKNIDLNQMVTDGIFSSKNHVENTLDLEADYLSRTQIEQFQRIAFTHLSNSSKKKVYIKIHDAFTFSENDAQPLIPETPSKIAIYFVRNPLDIALSLANHIGKSVEEAIGNYIINPTGYFGNLKNSTNNQFYQPLGTWSMHVESWLTRPNFPVHFMRYEDMKERPFETFKAAVQAIGLDVSEEQIRFAINESQFEKLQKKEQEKGFIEKQNPSSTFFFKGQVGRWKEELSEEQIEKIRHYNEPMMRRFGYW
ncbi:sulfotransferase [Emticicia oligotrophica DSM 17448]|uniref:Sulfotransferase n=1 Tax=Emticicia oligotrophica (strain DSM 17448 / CIP 109782 / MTCC 6937 / GPTSA100-15) TaxID=929562 RepID=A0ABM5MYZ1_EMTOG|nr:sulfotransferase domain-containing protein [Emticicia oligotrophica]AFK02406.1 sulfotransferase [Emticicia oligotrophica DSM 17448]